MLLKRGSEARSPSNKKMMALVYAKAWQNAALVGYSRGWDIVYLLLCHCINLAIYCFYNTNVFRLLVWVTSFLPLIWEQVDQSEPNFAQVTDIQDGNICKFEEDPTNIAGTAIYIPIVYTNVHSTYTPIPGHQHLLYTVSIKNIGWIFLKFTYMLPS